MEGHENENSHHVVEEVYGGDQVGEEVARLGDHSSRPQEVLQVLYVAVDVSGVAALDGQDHHGQQLVRARCASGCDRA